MKKVAATRGQSVSLAVFFFVEEIAPVGNRAGRERVLNFLSRPPSATLALSSCLLGASSQKSEYGEFGAMQEKYAPNCIFFHGPFRAVLPPEN
jgi:hypothetical protein